MMLRTPDGTIDVRALQQRAAEQLAAGVVTDDIKAAVGLLAAVTDELESMHSQVENLREIDQIREDLRASMTY